MIREQFEVGVIDQGIGQRADGGYFERGVIRSDDDHLTGQQDSLANDEGFAGRYQIGASGTRHREHSLARGPGNSRAGHGDSHGNTGW
jgi:hypothetical protein